MELINSLLLWILVGGSVLGVIYVIVSIAVGRYFYKEYKKSEEYHANHAKKMEEKRKEFDEQHRKFKEKMDKFR
ncbi:hypothetical protein [Aerococcus urinaeequi]|uniref:hypothetical protein n=1 Tax=Aerococcus urinaeequi TaxID=51665 RepID=UPI0036710E6C